MQKIKNFVKYLHKHQPHHLARLVFGACFISLAASLFLMFYVSVPKGYSKTEALVTEVNYGVSGKTDSSGYYAVMQFQANGKQYKVNGQSHPKALHQKDQKIPVAYFNANPYVARDLSDRQVPLLAYVLLALPVLAVVFLIAERFYFWWEAYDVPADAEDKQLEAETQEEAATEDAKLGHASN